MFLLFAIWATFAIAKVYAAVILIEMRGVAPILAAILLILNCILMTSIALYICIESMAKKKKGDSQ